MRHLRRLGIAVGALGALIALMSGTALAGGWAEVSMVDGSEEPPVAGEEREIRFSLLQHGVTAVDFGEVELTAVHAESGQVITARATNHGGGRWSAAVTFPVEGNWQIGVAHNDLETSEPTMVLAVGQIDGLGWLPGAISVGAFLVAAVVVLGSMLLIGRRRPATDPTTTAARAG